MESNISQKVNCRGLSGEQIQQAIDNYVNMTSRAEAYTKGLQDELQEIQRKKAEIKKQLAETEAVI